VIWKPSGQTDRHDEVIVAFRNFANAPGEVHTEFWWGDLGERDQLEDLRVDGSRLLKRIFKRLNGKPWSGILFFRGGTGGG
jgi:hypothetical protein